MTIVEITDSHLRVVVQGMDKVLALKSTIEVPLAHVRGATPSPDALREPHGLRLLGTSLPGVVAADARVRVVGQTWGPGSDALPTGDPGVRSRVRA